MHDICSQERHMVHCKMYLILSFEANPKSTVNVDSVQQAASGRHQGTNSHHTTASASFSKVFPYPPITHDRAKSMKNSCISFPTPITAEISRSIKFLGDFHFRVHLEPISILIQIYSRTSHAIPFPKNSTIHHVSTWYLPPGRPVSSPPFNME